MASARTAMLGASAVAVFAARFPLHSWVRGPGHGHLLISQSGYGHVLNLAGHGTGLLSLIHYERPHVG